MRRVRSHRVGAPSGGGTHPAAHADGNEPQRDPHEHELQRHLASRRDETGHPMGVPVAQEQNGLEEEHTGGPDRGGAAEQRQDHLREHRLDAKKQGGAQEKRRPVCKSQVSPSGVTARTLPSSGWR